MNGITNRVADFAYRLRGPERFILKLRAMTSGRTFPCLHQLEDLAAQYGIEVVEVEKKPGLEGFATIVNGTLAIGLSEGLEPFNRQFVLAHEMGHVLLHLSLNGKNVDFRAYVVGNDPEVEADTFAILCLMDTIPSDRLIQDGLKYMLTNRNMARRAFRVIRYFSGYRLKIVLATVLERMLPASTMRGAA
jgi:Zn-dependent peptidase ImmA (M78 family)